jgi:hypothetical protein
MVIGDKLVTFDHLFSKEKKIYHKGGINIMSPFFEIPSNLSYFSSSKMLIFFEKYLVWFGGKNIHSFSPNTLNCHEEVWIVF